MSMPGKGNKHHHMPHHHQQQHHPQQQQLHQASHVVNVNVNQTGVTHTPQYNTVVAANQRFVPHAGSDFHVPNQSYGAQPGGQVGGGGGNVGVPGGRGPPLGGIQSIGQTQTGIPPGGPAGGQHPPPQAPTPGVQQQQPQGPTPTTTPPVHTPSPQEMGKQGHLQTVFVANQQRPTSQSYYQTGPRPQQPRGMNHRGGQGGGSTQVLSMGGAPGAGAQQMQYPHPNFSGMYVQSQLSNLQPQHQQHVNYPMSMPLRPPQPHHSQGQGPFYQYPHPPATIVTSPYFFPPQSANFTLYPVNHPYVRAASANAVNSNAQHMQGQLTNAQGSTVVPQGTLQQPAQQPQQMPTMIPVAPSEVFTGHNGGASGASSVTNRSKRRSNAIPIINPDTGESVSDQIYNEIAKGAIDNREAPQMQNCDKAVIADFAAMVAKAATESSSDSPVASSAPESPNSQIASQSLSNLKVQTNSTTNSQSNTGPPTPTQTLPGALTSPSQSLGTSSNAAQLESCPVKVDSKPLQPSIKEFQPRGGSDVKIVTTTPVVAEQLHVQLNSTATITNKDNKIPTQPPGVSVPAVMPVNEIELKNNNNTATLPQATVAVAAATATAAATTTQTSIQSSTTSSNTSDVLIPSSTAVGANNPVPAKDPFPNLVNKNKSSSPPRRKYQNSNIPANAITIPEMPPLIKESKEHKERKANEKNANSSRGTTPTPVHNQPEHIHQKTNGETSEKSDVETLPKIETQQKTTDGKSAMQKQKNKSKQKNREISRKGAEKESGSDMDAFMNSVPTGKIVETKQTEIKEALPQRDSNKEPIKELTKDIKEKDNHESKKEKQQAVPQTHEKQHSTPEIPMENTTSVEKAPPAITFNHKDSKPTIEERSKSPIAVSNMSPIPNDVVDHSVTIKTEIDLTLIVAQKNEENSKVSALRTSIEETVTVIEKQDENAAPNQIETIPKGPQVLKYKYLDDQWSPINQKGKKTYGRDFLIQLQDDPHSRIKPTNLPDMEVVLKDSKTRQHVSRNRSPEIKSFKDHNMRGHDSFLPGFAKNSMNAKLGGLPPANKKSNSGKPRPPSKPNMVMPISLSLREEVKLREAENAWKPTRLKASDVDVEEAKTESLAKKVRSVLNKLTPQKFDTLVSQVRALNIDTKERMERVINLVFEKAIDEPSFSVEYALMCKELAMMQVSGTDPSDSTTANFRKLIITRCQHEFQKESENGELRETKSKEIEECTDAEKKKELILFYEEEERRIRMKSVGNIRFIGELFKQGMLTKNIMLFCINHLLQFRDEENLECLCKLLTTIGKKLESKDELNDYFNQMRDIANDKGPGKINSRVRFMLKDVIDLRANKWVPRRDDSNPKTMDQIQKEAETERLDAQLNVPLNTPRKDDRNADRRRNRGMTGSSEDGGWSQPVRSRASYSCDTSKLKTKPPLMDDLQLGNRNTYTMWNKNIPSVGSTKMQNKFSALESISSFDQEKRNPLQLSGSKSMGPRECGRTDYKSSYDGRSSRNGSSYQLSSSGSLTREGIPPLDSGRSQSVTMPPQSKPAPQPTSISNKPEKSFDELQKIVHMFVGEYITEGNGEDVVIEVKQHFPTSQLPAVVREIVNEVLEKSVSARESVSKLLSFLITKKSITLNDFRKGFGEILESVDDLIIDIPKILSYFADILVHLVIDETHPIAELPITLASLRSAGQSGKLVGELFSKVATICGPEFLVEKWLRSKLQISDLINGERENIDEIIKNYKLQALTEEKFTSFDQIHDHLVKLMKNSNNILDDVVTWTKNNISDKVLEPQFIRVLMTAILEVSTVCNKQRHDFKPEIFQGLQTLIQRFVDANEKLELQCLFAVQSFASKLEFPSGLLLNIFDKLCEDNVISYESFISWETNDDAVEREGKAVALKALTSFFTSLKEAEEEVSEEETSAQVR